MSNRTLHRQKARERFLLERFIDAAKLNAQIIEEREAPDFMVRVDDALVGVEVTELFISYDRQGSTPQAGEAISSLIAVKAQHPHAMPLGVSAALDAKPVISTLRHHPPGYPPAQRQEPSVRPREGRGLHPEYGLHAHS